MPAENISSKEMESLVVKQTPSEIMATWSDSQEKLLKSIAERSNCMRWLHTECNSYFESLNFYFTIPNIVISTLNGSITMSLTALFPDPRTQQNATTIIGLVSIFSAVLITMNQYVKSQQMAEAHHSSGLSYAKLYRNIMNELSLRRDQRSNGLDFLKQVRTEIDRLESTSPSILPFAIKKFNIIFSKRDIEKPEITGDLDAVEINSEVTHKTQLLSNYTKDIDTSTLDVMEKALPIVTKPTVLSNLGSIISTASKLFVPDTRANVDSALSSILPSINTNLLGTSGTLEAVEAIEPVESVEVPEAYCVKNPSDSKEEVAANKKESHNVIVDMDLSNDMDYSLPSSHPPSPIDSQKQDQNQNQDQQ